MQRVTLGAAEPSELLQWCHCIHGTVSESSSACSAKFRKPHCTCKTYPAVVSEEHPSYFGKCDDVQALAYPVSINCLHKYMEIRRGTLSADDGKCPWQGKLGHGGSHEKLLQKS